MGFMKDRLQQLVDSGMVICYLCGDYEDGPWASRTLSDLSRVYVCEPCHENSKMMPIEQQEVL